MTERETPRFDPEKERARLQALETSIAQLRAKHGASDAPPKSTIPAALPTTAGSDASPVPEAHVDADGTIACPYCAERIQAAAVLCRFCGSRLKATGVVEPTRARGLDEGIDPEPSPPPLWPIFCLGIFGYLYVAALCRRRGIDTKRYTRALLVTCAVALGVIVVLTIGSLVLLRTPESNTTLHSNAPLAPATSGSVDANGWPILADGTHARLVDPIHLKREVAPQTNTVWNLFDLGSSLCDGYTHLGLTALYDIRYDAQSVEPEYVIGSPRLGDSVTVRLVASDSQAWQFTWSADSNIWKFRGCAASR